MQISLNTQSKLVGMNEAEVYFFPNYLSETVQQSLFDRLTSQVEWRQDSIKLYGKTHQVPRLQYWMADQGLDYRYSGIGLKSNGWHPEIDKLRKKLQQDFDVLFNSVLLNLYRDGQDSNGWHSDDEPELGERPTIASISLGADRDFRFRHKSKGDASTHKLQAGSLLWMQGDSQTNWQHCVPKRAEAKPRINLTFRQIIVT
jgi:alkylated DNA repair dioxygenase AlkB